MQNNSLPPGRLTLKSLIPRLNPFLLPSETTTRFILLIAAVLAASLLISSTLGPRFYLPNLKSKSEECKKQSIWNIDPKRTYTNAEEYNIVDHNSIVASICFAPYYQALIFWETSGVVLVLGLATLLYWLLPIWKLWFEKLLPLDTEDPPEVLTYMQELCSEVGIVRPPRFVWNPLNPRKNAHAFGRLGRYYVALTGGLVMTFYHDKQIFRSILLHELAHLRNSDVSKGYFTLALGWSFQIALLLFIILEGPAIIHAPGLFATILISSLLLSGFITVRRNAVLRVRELYADVRASIWDTLPGSLARVLEVPASPKGLWHRLQRFHPDPDERQKALNETHQLLHIDKWECLAVGIIVGLSILPLLDFFQVLLQVLAVHTGLFSLRALYEWITALVLAPFIVGVIGLGIWRETFAALIRNEKPRNIFQVSTYLGLGIGLGMFLPFNPSSFLFQIVLGINTNFILLFLYNMLLIVSLSLFLLLFVQWIKIQAQMWMQIAIVSPSPRFLRLACFVGLGVASFVLFVGLAECFHLYEITLVSSVLNILYLPILLSFGFLHSLVSNPLVTCMIACFVVWPLATWFWQKRITGAPMRMHWGFLDRPALVITFLAQRRVRLRFAFFIGLSCASIYWTLSIIFLNKKVDVLGLGPLSNKEYPWIAFALFLQIAAAVVVAGKMKRLALLHGLFAAFITGFFIALCLIWRRILYADTDGIVYALIQIINGGAVFVLPMALEVTLFAAWIRKSKHSFLWGKVALASGLLYYSFLLLIWFWRLLMYPESILSASDFWLVASRGHIVMAFFLQAVSIGFVITYIKRRRILEGLLATFINAGIITLSVVLNSLISQQHLTVAFFLLISGGTVSIGIFMTLLTTFYPIIYKKMSSSPSE